jgi:pimeloyl-ACP methyl ester carboxylesterase
MPDLLAEALTARPGDKEAVESLLAAADPTAPPLAAPGAAEILWIPVEGAELRVLHVLPPGPPGCRPIVLVPGWGGIPEAWHDFMKAVHERAELYYIETREKPSSRIVDRRTDMSVVQSARDLARVLESLGLAGRDYVLVAASWGSTTVLSGMVEDTLHPPTVLLADPMHALWFPKWVLRYVSPLLPAGVLRLLRPLLANAILGDMQEPTQRARVYSFVYEADVWKWKKSAEAARDVELYGTLTGVRDEVFVLNGTADKVHDPVDYPRMCSELPRGRFLFMPTDESRRELLFGAAALELARVTRADGLPPSLARFERRVR